MATVKKQKNKKIIGKIEKRGDSYVFVMFDPNQYRSKPSLPNQYPDA